MVDALSQRAGLLATRRPKVIGFECLKDNYQGDENFGQIWEKCLRKEDVHDFLWMVTYSK